MIEFFGIGSQFAGLGSFFPSDRCPTQGIGPDLLGKINFHIWVRLVIFMVQAWAENRKEDGGWREPPNALAKVFIRFCIPSAINWLGARHLNLDCADMSAL